MAIHDSNTTAQETQVAQQGDYQEQFNNLNQQAKQAASGFNTMGTNRVNPFSGRMFGSAMSKTRGSNNIKVLTEKLLDVYENNVNNTDIIYDVLPVDKAGTNLLYGGILVVVKPKSPENAPTYYHTLILESTGEPLKARSFSTPGALGGVIDYEVTYSTSQVWDEEYVKVTREIVQRAFPKSTPHQVDATVVPREFSVEDDELVYTLARNAITACGTELEVCSPGFKDLSIKEIVGSAQANISISFNNNETLKDAVGRPIKSDIIMGYSLTKKAQQQQPGQYSSLNKATNDAEAGALSAYIDLIWSFEGMPFNGMINSSQGMYGQQSIPALYTPNLIITGLEAEYGMTPASILLTLVNVMAIEQHGMWKQYFKPLDVAKGQVDLRDLGFIGYELIPHIKSHGGNVDESVLKGGNSYIDIKSDKIGLDVLYGIINMAMSQQIFISLDVPDASPTSWALRMFADASNGNVEAMNVIIRAANQLTDGAFDKFYKTSGNMFYNTGNRIHLGYYRDGNGELQDIRDVTYLAALALSKGDTSLVKDYSETWNRVDYDINLRLSSRKRMISAFTGDSAIITGYGTRVTFGRDFMYALTAACNAAGYIPRLQTAYIPTQGSLRSIPNYLNNVLIDNNQFHTSSGSQGFNGGLGNISGQYYSAQPVRFV